MDELREGRLLPLVPDPAAGLGRSVERSRRPLRERNRAFADLLKTIVLEAHLVIELVRGTRSPPRELRRQVAQVGVKPLEVGVLIGDDLAQEAVKTAERLHLATPQLGFVFPLRVAVRFGEARHRPVQHGVHRLVVERALTPPGLEEYLAEARDLLVQVDAGSVQVFLDRIHPGRIDLVAHLRPFVVRLERFADFFAVVHEVENEGVLLAGVGPVQRERVCTAWMPASRLSTYIVCSRGWSKPVWYFSATSSTWYSWAAKTLRQLLLPDSLVHLLLGVGDAGRPVVLDDSREGHQRLDRVSLLPDVAIEALLVANRFEARPGDHHRLGAPANPVAGDGVEVLHHHFRLLRDVVRVQPHETSQGAGGLLPLHVRIVRTRLEQPVVGGIRRVVIQHVEDEALLDRLAHGVPVGGLAAAPEDLQGLVLRGRGEGEEAQVRLPPAFGHAEKERFQVLAAFEVALRGRLTARPHAQRLAAEHLLERGRRLAACELCASSMITA